MAVSCTAGTKAYAEGTASELGPPVEAPVQTLLEVVRRHATPTYAYDMTRLGSQVARLRASLPTAVDILYSLKANASLGICSYLASQGLGADVASAGELITANAAGFSPERIFLSGPDKSPAVLSELNTVPEAVISLDSVSELQLLAKQERPNRALLRLRPDFSSFAVCSAGSDSRFGLLLEDLPRCREYLSSRRVKVVGFHIFSGSQVLDPAGITHHLRNAMKLALLAGDMLELAPQIINLGGGFGIPYGPHDRELDLSAVAEDLRGLMDLAGRAQIVLELGRYLVAQAGWYLTTVLAEQTHRGRNAVVVDGGNHQRADLCGIGLRHKAYAPRLLAARDGPLVPTDVLGCLSLPADVLIEASPLPPLKPGDVLAFPNAGAYGLWASPAHFHGHPFPAEVGFEGNRLELLRARRPVRSLLEGQARW
jgi:diaminopimelate decarboxylase